MQRFVRTVVGTVVRVVLSGLLSLACGFGEIIHHKNECYLVERRQCLDRPAAVISIIGLQ